MTSARTTKVEIPEPIGAVMPEGGTVYVDCY